MAINKKEQRTINGMPINEWLDREEYCKSGQSRMVLFRLALDKLAIDHELEDEEERLP